MNRLFLPSLSMIATSLAPGVAAADWRGDLTRVFHDQVRACYFLPIKAVGSESVVMKIRLRPDGDLDGEPQIIQGKPKSIAADAALRAVKRCSPFKIPSNIGPWYQKWKVMLIEFNTRK